MRDHYCWPVGMDYDANDSGDDPFVSNPKYETFNAPEKTQALVDYILLMTESYPGS